MTKPHRAVGAEKDRRIVLKRRSRSRPSSFVFFSGVWWVVYEDILKPAHPQGTADELPDYALVELFRERRRKKEEDRKLRTEVLTETGGHCIYCDKHASKVELTIEHLLPVSRGGKDTYANLAAACSGCNNKRGNSSKPLRLVHPAWKDFVSWKLGGCRPHRVFVRGRIKKWIG